MSTSSSSDRIAAEEGDRQTSSPPSTSYLPAPPTSDAAGSSTAAYPYDLGNYTLPISTSSSAAQTWFNRGLIWSFGFHHAEAVRCFERAAECDPEATMAYWGMAYAGGPNYNKPWELFDAADLGRTVSRCHTAANEAVRLARTPLEAALAGAIRERFPQAHAGDHQAWNIAYIAAMKRVYDSVPDDLDVAALYADSLMSLAPWQLWDLQTGQPNPKSHTLTTKSVLDRALLNPASTSHPFILHLYIHLMELSPTPEVAVVPADHLRHLCPDVGHLKHMPGHIDLLIGDYRRAIDSNIAAIVADEKYRLNGSSTDFYTFYRLHDYTFPIYAGMFNGQLGICLDTVTGMEQSLTEEMYRIDSPPMVDWMEGFKSWRMKILLRFGKWHDILAMPFPEDRAFYCVTTTLLHYGRGVAHAVLGDTEAAEAERTAFRQARTTVPPTRMEFPNTWASLFDIAEAMLTGELEYRRGNHDVGFASLRKAIRLSDTLIYAEPWGWVQPPRHALAALLLEQGQVEEASLLYAQDLGYDTSLPRAARHPNNVWALHGYHECLVKLGRDTEARMLEPQLTLALAVADVQIESSCYCRTVKADTCCRTADGVPLATGAC